MSFLQELRRRKVFRVAALYIVGAWVVLQVADLAFESWDIASSALRYVWLGAVLGFPVALVFGWRYDISAQGIMRTPAAGADEQIELTLQRSDYVILALMSALTAKDSYNVTYISRLVKPPDNFCHLRQAPPAFWNIDTCR
jgi:hypothetical protein